MRPRVVVHMTQSLDGRTTGFEVDMALHYGAAAAIGADAHLAGSGTLLAAGAGDEGWGTGGDVGDGASEGDSGGVTEDKRGLLVVPDSRGRVRGWAGLLGAGFWRSGVALVSRATPPSYGELCRRLGVDVIEAGDDRVDLGRALEILGERHGVRVVHCDGGGTLNGALLRAGLVDEVSMLIAPLLAGGPAAPTLFEDPLGRGNPIVLRTIGVETLAGGVLHARYRVEG